MSYPKEVIIMLSMYPACFYKEENGYSVIFPGLDVATCHGNGGGLSGGLSLGRKTRW